MTNQPSRLHDEPTESDKQDDLAHQYAKLQKDPQAVIFCPWCSKINKPEMPPCCPFFAQGVDQIGRDKLESVARQLREVRLGAKKSIHCPYCSSYIKSADHPVDWPRPFVSPFCCDLMSDAATALTERRMLERLSEDKKRIEDGIVSTAAGKN